MSHERRSARSWRKPTPRLWASRSNPSSPRRSRSSFSWRKPKLRCSPSRPRTQYGRRGRSTEQEVTRMEYVYGALVLHAAGKPVNEENLKKVLTAAGVKVDETRVKALTAALEGVNIDEALKAAVAMPAAAPATAPAPE